MDKKALSQWEGYFHIMLVLHIIVGIGFVPFVLAMVIAIFSFFFPSYFFPSNSAGVFGLFLLLPFVLGQLLVSLITCLMVYVYTDKFKMTAFIRRMLYWSIFSASFIILLIVWANVFPGSF